MKIAMLGTRGVPARYGGFETAVEEIGSRLAEAGHEVVVFCRRDGSQSRSYRGMRLVHLPAVKHRVTETLTHTALSVLHREARNSDVAILFNAANAALIPVLRAARVPVAVHVDGLEWQRSKWNGAGKAYYRTSERLACRWADALIADARGIQDYYESEHATESVFIPYGAPILDSANNVNEARLRSVGLSKQSFHLVVARFEPENNVHVALDAYASSRAMLPLVVVGAAPYEQDYHRDLGQRASVSDSVKMLGAVWDQGLLNDLYRCCLTYIHGHSVGGTNPSLLRAMGAGAPVLAYDVVFNREVAGEHALYWAAAPELSALLDEAEASPSVAIGRGLAGRQRVAALYNWDDVARDYLALCESLRKPKRTSSADFRA